MDAPDRDEQAPPPAPLKPGLLLRGALKKAWTALREGRLPPSPRAWVSLLGQHVDESFRESLREQARRSEISDSRSPLESPPELKERFTQAARASLEGFLATGERLAVGSRTRPKVSVLLVLYNRAELTLRCLRSLSERRALPLEVVIVDNASSDRTSALLSRVDGAKVLRNGDNVGFVHAVNQAARKARGEHLLLLNNDAELLPGSLEAAVRTLEQEPDAGAVVGRILHLDGRLQEAGSIVFSDGSCRGYGRGGDPLSPEFLFRRDVDFGSGAFLLTPRALFEELGGLDVDYAPAYSEDVDYCVRLWRQGRRVVYEPQASILHFEFASSRSKEAAIALQQSRRAIFQKKHAEWLPTRGPSTGGSALAQRAAKSKPRVLFVDDRVPHPQLGAGNPRAKAMLEALVEAGMFVTHYPVADVGEPFESVYRDVPASVEVMAGLGPDRLAAFLAERAGYYDALLVSRPHNFERVLPLLGKERPPLLIYDAEALFAAREVARRRCLGERIGPEAERRLLAPELQLAREADVVLAVSRREAQSFSDAGCPHVKLLTHVVVLSPGARPLRERAGLLFVGAIQGDRAPNADALLWFIRRILPRIRTARPDAALSVVGENASLAVGALASPQVTFHGAVPTVAPHYDAARVFVAPTRFSAGVPMKVHEAAAHGLPVVATAQLADQLGWRDGEELLCADGEADFARKCLALLEDDALWRHLRERALARVKADCDRAAFGKALREVMAPILGRPAADRGAA